jgi:hypothetical protein
MNHDWGSARAHGGRMVEMRRQRWEDGLAAASRAKP